MSLRAMKSQLAGRPGIHNYDPLSPSQAHHVGPAGGRPRWPGTEERPEPHCRLRLDSEGGHANHYRLTLSGLRYSGDY